MPHSGLSLLVAFSSSVYCQDSPLFFTTSGLAMTLSTTHPQGKFRSRDLYWLFGKQVRRTRPFDKDRVE